jgi:DNA-binding beta-propeller fold protein YncE
MVAYFTLFFMPSFPGTNDGGPMMTKKFLPAALLFLLSLSVQPGCAFKAPDQVSIFWPPLPEEPRISYVRKIRQVSDIQDPSFLDMLFGTDNMALFQMPYGVSEAAGNIYVSDTEGSSIVIIDQNQKKARFLVSEEVRIKTPIGVAAGADGTIYVTDAEQGVVLLFNQDRSYKGAIGKKGEMKRPAGLALNNNLGRIYIADSTAHTIHAYSLKGERLFSFGKRGPGDTEFNHPTNLAIDRRNDNILVTDTNNFRVQRFDKDGKFLSKFGELGDQFGTFSRPKGIGVDSEGNVYVADAAFNNVQVFSSEGRLLTFFCGPGRRPGELQLPAGLYVDENDRIYVVDQRNTRVQVFQYMSEKWKKEHPDEYKKVFKTAEPDAKQNKEQ